MLYSASQLDIIRYCAEECNRQHSGALSVYNMIRGWTYANESVDVPVDLEMIETIGTLVEPIKNANGFRTIPIFVGSDNYGYIEKAPFERITELLEGLLDAYYSGILNSSGTGFTEDYYPSALTLAKSPEDVFYYEYENIHPFVDGNGRSGKILYNYLRKSMKNPAMPPNFWGVSNP